MRTLPAPDTARHINEFEVSKTEDGWRAIHRTDPQIVVEASDWEVLELCCAARRIARTLNRAAAELAS